jgi:serine O-acetyltransferase
MLHGIPLVPRAVEVLIFLIFGAVIPCSTEIGEGTVLAHGGLGNVFHPQARIGKRVLIAHNVTIGGKSTRAGGVPVIGNDVYIGAGARILGNIEIGNDSLIGANAVVVASVPPGSMVVGVPATIKKSGIRARDYETW